MADNDNLVNELGPGNSMTPATVWTGTMRGPMYPLRNSVEPASLSPSTLSITRTSMALVGATKVWVSFLPMTEAVSIKCI